MTNRRATCCLALAGACVIGAATVSPATRSALPEAPRSLSLKQPQPISPEVPQSMPLAIPQLLTPEVPRGVRLQRVLSDASINGQAAAVWAFSSRESPHELVRTLAAHWHVADSAPILPPAPRFVEQGPWMIASRVWTRGLEVVQVQAHPEGASGFWTVWSSRPTVRSVDAMLAALLPNSVRIVNRLTSNDPGGRSASVVAESVEPVGALAQALALRAVGVGLRPTPAPGGSAQGADPLFSSKPPALDSSSRLLRFAAPGRELLLTLTRHDARTVVVAHWLETTP